MSVIKPLIPPQCPNCQSEGTLVLEEDSIRCKWCGHQETRAQTKVPAAQKAEKRRLQASYALTHIGEVDRWARAAFDTGQDCIRREDWDGALTAFRRAVEAQADFVDAHLWIARIVEDESVQRDHLTTILAYQPNHLEAMRELMVLNGELTLEEAARLNDFSDVQKRSAGVSVGAKTAAPTCVNCGGKLTTETQNGRVICAYCGHKQPLEAAYEGGDSVMTALLKQRAKGVQWIIGERTLRCNQCGAERTLPGDKLSSHCLFCGSTQVIVQDALDSFRQPDGIVSFAINRQEAEQTIRKQLGSRIERLKGLFDNNKVTRAALQGVYLPFWVFDSVLDVTVTTIDTRTWQGRVAQPVPYSSVNVTEMCNNVAISAVQSPPPRLIEKLGSYDFQSVSAYEPKVLSEFPAELYTLDFDRASLEARGRISELMRQKYADANTTDGVEIRTMTIVRQMFFQLLLLPVWIGTLVEEDGDIRLALVNGQTGKLVMGASRRAV